MGAVAEERQSLIDTWADPPRILLVDDEPSLLEGLRRQLRGRFDVSTAPSGGEALLLAAKDPFAVVVSDMRMPGMDGVSLLRAMRGRWSDTVRVLLTGHADLDAAVAAVNEGNVFRFLTKPCEPEVLRTALDQAVEQHRLITAERELLERTLNGAVQALLETLSLANPMAFARAERVRSTVKELLDALEISDRWAIEVACVLSQIGAVTLPPPVAEKLHAGLPLDEDEEAMVERLPEIAERLLGAIPRLDEVRAIIRAQRTGAGFGDVPLGARILRVALDFDTLEARRTDLSTAIGIMRSRGDVYDQVVVDALAAGEGGHDVREVRLDDLRTGMVLLADVHTGDGLLLLGRGQPVTPGLLERMRNFARGGRLGLDEVVAVSSPQGGSRA